jgi:hypothetical protein
VLHYTGSNKLEKGPSSLGGAGQLGVATELGPISRLHDALKLLDELEQLSNSLVTTLLGPDAVAKKLESPNSSNSFASLDGLSRSIVDRLAVNTNELRVLMERL